ncbi:MAG: Lrp/AsnC family transcriptional regulator [Anaerolineaceae bacterium]
MVKIDEIDKKIPDLLIFDGRMSCPEIARRMGKISERSVRYRIDRLTKNRIISIRASIDAAKVGFPIVGDVFLEVEPGLVQEFAQKLAGYEMISYIACSTGDKDISLQIFARDHTELYTLVTEEISKISGVRRTHTSFVPFIVKDDIYWPIPFSCVDYSSS